MLGIAISSFTNWRQQQYFTDVTTRRFQPQEASVSTKKKIQSTGEKKIKITQIEGTSSRTITDFHL